MTSTAPDVVDVSIGHLANLDKYAHEKPYELWLEIAPGQPKTNCEYTDNKVALEDARSSKIEYDLDVTGFKYVNHVSQHLPKWDELRRDKPPVDYLAEAAELVKKELDAEKVVVFNWAFRSNQRGAANVPYSFNGTFSTRAYALNPAHLAHSDFSYSSGREMVEKYLSKEEKQEWNSAKYHIRFVNVWRPLIPVVEDAPMAYCDIRTIEASEYLPFDRVLDTGSTELMYLTHRPTHKWSWLSRQKSSEPALFVTWDSKNGDGATVAHAAFDHPDTPKGANKRRSMEVQIMAFNRLP